MIALLAIFGILLTIGTIADFILNILNLRVLPEKFLQVKIKVFEKIINFSQLCLDVPRVFNLHEHYQVVQYTEY